MGQSPSSDDNNYVGEGLPFLQGNAEFGESHPSPQLYCTTAAKECRTGDILISVRAPVGALNVADQSYGIGRGLCAVRTWSNVLDAGYCSYSLEIARIGLAVVATGSTYVAVSASDVGNLNILLPPLPEQRAIVAFLDRETAQLDALVAAKQRLIALLQEKRAALISHAVTRGLDPAAPLKDSGVAWLGQIPAHWQASLSRLRFARVRRVHSSAEHEDRALVLTADGECLRQSELPEYTARDRFDDYGSGAVHGLGGAVPRLDWP